MLRLATIHVFAILSVIVAAEDMSEEDDVCPVGESCRRAALLQARTDVRIHGAKAVFASESHVDGESEDATEAKSAERQGHMVTLNLTHLAYRTRLRRTMTALNQSVTYSNDEIDKIIEGFVEDQAASTDSCPARLLEAKHQLNELHAQIVDLANEVQVTEKELRALEVELADIRQLIDSVTTFCQGEEIKCGAKGEDNKKMLATLKKELIEMQQIAGAQVTIDISQQGALSSTTSTSSTGFVSASTGEYTHSYSPIAWSVSYGVGESTSTTTGGAGGAGGAASSTTTTGMTTGQWTTSTTSGAWTTGAVGASGTTTTGFGGGGAYSSSSSSTTTTGGYRGGGAHGGRNYHGAGLIQSSLSAEPHSADGVINLVTETKQLATDLVQCMAKSEEKPQSLLQAAKPQSLLHAAQQPGEKWQCKFCHHVYDPAKDGKGKPFADLPDSWRCPVCGAPKSAFKMTVTGQYAHTHAAPPPPAPAPAVPVTQAPTPAPTQAPVGPAYGVSYGGGTMEGGTYHPPATEGPPECPATLEVDAYVGDAQKVVGSGRPLREGEHSTVECSEINPKYKGSVWLVCTNGRLSAKNEHCFEQGADSNQCEEYKKNLESTYIKAYVNLVRTIAEYESLVAGADCHSSVYNRCLTQNRGNYEKLEDVTRRMSHLQEMLLGFKTRFESAKRAEKLLQDQIQTLSGECASMEETASCLHKVRDAIHILGLCPGMGRPQFKIPIWTGTWATGDVNCANMQDEQIDSLLNTLCQQQVSEDGTVARAAECSEIEEHTIEAAPTENSARVPLIGACPNCEGESNAESGLRSRSGHSRKCWDPQAVLSGGGCRKNCQNGMKAVMCVYDRSHIANYFTAQTTQTTQAYGGQAMGGQTYGGGQMVGGHQTRREYRRFR